VPAPAAQEPAPGAGDPELLALFIDEAREEVATIIQLYPLWDENAADREALARVRRGFHTLKGSGRMVGARPISELGWSIEQLLNRVIDGTLERSAPLLATLRDAVALLPRLVEEIAVSAAPAADAGPIMERAALLISGRTGPVPVIAPAATLPPASEPTQIMPPIGEQEMERLLAAVPPVAAAATPPLAPPAIATESAAETVAVPPAAMPEEPPALEEPAVAAAVPEPPFEAAAVPEPEAAVAAAAAVEQWTGRPAEFAARGDATLQDIYRKEVQSHLEVVRAYLREAWATPGPHRVTEDLYRACHTLRGASRTAEVSLNIRLAEPLHRWLRRMFDHDAAFDEAGLALLADCAVAFEDVITAVHESSGYFPNIDRLVDRIAARDAAIEQELSARAESALGPAPQPVEPVVVTAALVPETVAAALVPETGSGDLLPRSPADSAIQGAPPFVVPPEEGAPAAEAGPAEPPAVSAPERPQDFDPAIAAIFSEEATELLEAADAALGALRAERGSRERVIELRRALHTLKGGARMAGIVAMGDLSHQLEWLLMQIDDGTVALDENSFEVLQSSLDELNRMRDYVNAGRPVLPARDLAARIRRVGRRGPETGQPPEAPRAPAPAAVEAQVVVPATPAPQRSAVEEQPAEPAGPVETVPAAATEEPAAPPVAPPREAATERGEVARVDADLLDALLNAAGEVSICRARVEQQLASVEFNLTELNRVVQRLKDQLRKLEIETEAQILHRHVSQEPARGDFDPLELDRYSAIQQYSRALAETSADVASVQSLLETQTREAQNLLTQQGRLISDLQGGLMRTRMVPFQRHVQRLTRLVRQVAAETGRKVELVVNGAAGELDRQVLERMLPPFEHMLRNAVVHGIESPAERLAAGKPDTGRIELRLRREGSEVVITVADDGAGINLKAVRDRAIALGLTTPRQELSDEQALQLIFEPGFSTADKVTQTAGRGVGMDIVATGIKKLGGSLYTETTAGQGTCFTARLPFTLAISQALIVRSGEEMFALPLPTVEGVVRVPRAEVRCQLAGEAAGFEYGGQQYRFQHLATLIGGQPATAPESDAAVPVILVRAGEHSTAIVTDELIGSREIVVKSVGPQISGIRGIAGATILGDGRICIIVDVGALVRSEWRQRPAAEVCGAPAADRRVFALVVDDSITVRRVTQRLLERNGMRVATARDGLDAIAALQDQVPDVILLDIEMPRMDGYEVASHVRNDPRLRDIPIVMITSRVGEKHRARAIELGVNAYLGKPYQESQLLQAIEPLVHKPAA